MEIKINLFTKKNKIGIKMEADKQVEAAVLIQSLRSIADTIDLKMNMQGGEKGTLLSDLK